MTQLTKELFLIWWEYIKDELQGFNLAEQNETPKAPASCKNCENSSNFLEAPLRHS